MEVTMFDQDEQYEVSDIGEDIQRREQLLAELKSIEVSEDWNVTNREYSDLKRKWKRIYYWESAAEDQLNDEFDAILDAFYGKRREGFKSNQAMKADLVTQAQALVTMANLQDATRLCNELMAQWKSVGSAGKEDDDRLWEAFNEARQVLFDRKQKHWEELQDKFTKARSVKQSLIEQASTIVQAEDIMKTNQQFTTLMNEWKAIGSAGKEYEDSLWNEFNAIRQAFYERREAYYSAMQGELDQKYKAKCALLEQAKTMVNQKTFTKENTEQMKKLNLDWKAIGNCGNNREDQIWREFRATMDSYFEGLRQFNEQKHAQWRQKMIDARSRKQEMIQNQKRQIKYMHDEIVGLLGQRAIDEMEEDIKEAEAFIQELEAEIADIDKTLGN